MAKRLSLKAKIAPHSKQEYDLLFKLYVHKDLTADEIANKFNIAVRTIYGRLKSHGIYKTRKIKSQFKHCSHCGQVLRKSS